MSAVAIAIRPPVELRLAIFETIPAGYLAHAVTDHGCEPLIQPGEVAVITDQEGLYPEPGGLYLIEHSNGKSYRGRERRVREVATASRDARGNWWTHSLRPRLPGTLNLKDGPYSDFNALAEKILGEVVGIYRPACGAALDRETEHG